LGPPHYQTLLQGDIALPHPDSGIIVNKRVLIINGHPDPRPERFCSALCDAYAKGAAAGGWDVQRLDAGMLNLAPASDGDTGTPPGAAAAIEQIRHADRLAIVFPLWLDGPPGSLGALFELAARAPQSPTPAGPPTHEKSARVIVTMDMPAFIQRPRARGESSTKSALSLPGVRKFEPMLIGSLQTLTPAQCNEWLEKVELLGAHEE
jgi:putative NADPH-quinone reductase